MHSATAPNTQIPNYEIVVTHNQLLMPQNGQHGKLRHIYVNPQMVTNFLW